MVGDLTKREMRGLQLMKRFPWILPAAGVSVWPIVLLASWYKLSRVFEHGSPHGITSIAELHALMNLEANATYDAFQVFAITVAHKVISDLTIAFYISVFSFGGYWQSRFLLKLWRLIVDRERRDAHNAA